MDSSFYGKLDQSPNKSNPNELRQKGDELRNQPSLIKRSNIIREL
jgi:hypothetical protein